MSSRFVIIHHLEILGENPPAGFQSRMKVFPFLWQAARYVVTWQGSATCLMLSWAIVASQQSARDFRVATCL